MYHIFNKKKGHSHLQQTYYPNINTITKRFNLLEIPKQKASLKGQAQAIK